MTVCDSIASVVTILASESHAHALVDGVQTVQSFFAANLINLLVLNIAPVTLVQGRTLFASERQLRLLGARAIAETGTVQLHYAIAN